MVGEIRRVAEAREALDRALQEEPGRILSVLAHAIGDIDLAENGSERLYLERRIRECRATD
jgi:plasmid stability protein